MSAQSYQANLPSVSTGNLPRDPGSSIWSKLGTAFGANDNAQLYQNALTENNRAYEQAMLRESRAYDEYLRNYNAQREDTQVQRMVKDIKAAGLNPWLALQSGGVSGSSAQLQSPGTSSAPGSSSSAKSKNKNDMNVSSLVLFLVSTARLAAALV